jgi:hypothetical protein
VCRVGRPPCNRMLGIPTRDAALDSEAGRICLLRTRSGRAMTAESAVFKFGPLIWQRFFSADRRDFAGDAPPIKSIGYGSLQHQFGTFDIECTFRPIPITGPRPPHREFEGRFYDCRGRGFWSRRFTVCARTFRRSGRSCAGSGKSRPRQALKCDRRGCGWAIVSDWHDLRTQRGTIRV